MYYRRLPTARIAIVSIALFFACGTIVFAQQSTNPVSQKTIAHNAVPTAVTPTASNAASPTPKKKLAKAKLTLTPTPTTVIKALGGIASPTPSPTTLLAQATTTPTPTTALTTAPATGSLIEQVNAYRASQGLGPVQSNGETCAFAATRAQEISSNFSHDLFNSRISSNTLPYAHWTAATENIAQTPNPNNVVPMWINSPGHAANMRADTPYVCIIQNGDYYAYEGMKP